jgi:hypothetical protein
MDEATLERATAVAHALTKRRTIGRYTRADVLRATANVGLAQLELALGMRSPEEGEAVDPYWARFEP